MEHIYFNEEERKAAISKAKSLEEMADYDVVKITRRQLKELLQAAAEEAVTKYKAEKPALTKADIMKITNAAERQRLIRENPHLFKH